MKVKSLVAVTAALMLISAVLPPGNLLAAEIVRPEEIKSKRLVVYDTETYEELAQIWAEYNRAYPSEYAYANWMYAARYADDENYSNLLEKGLEKYPANPTLLYLSALNQQGYAGSAKATRLLERAIELDPAYSDVWFSLVINYMIEEEREKIDLALRKLLESGTIQDEVMDYNYNVLVGLEDNAILITNGDNDTYPAWVLTRVLGIRPDVHIVNRSLLNSEWYPGWVIKNGVPHFLGDQDLTAFRDSVWQKYASGDVKIGAGGPFGDTLIKRIVHSAKKAGRPVYLAKTLYTTEELEDLAENGRDLGLAVLVSSSDSDESEQRRAAFTTWIEKFRTGGLQSWRLKNAAPADASRMIIRNYAHVLAGSLPVLKSESPELRLPLFEWYMDNINGLLSGTNRAQVAQSWACYADDIEAVDEWVKKQGFTCPQSDQ